MPTPPSLNLIALILCCALASSGCDRSAPRPAPIHSPPLSTLPQAVGLAQDFQRGACLAHNYQHSGLQGYGSKASKDSKQELAALGVNWVSLTPFGWQHALDSTEVHFNPDSPPGESDFRLEEEVKQARALGMKVMLKPHLWISFSDWRGHIQPKDPGGWEAWFESYTTFILHYARLAERLKLDAFVIGLELASASPHRDPWVKMIEAIRAVYSGPLIYAANWNETDLVAFWDKVDWIGVQFFAPLSKNISPSYETLLTSAREHLKGYAALSKKHNKPIILTEYGYKSIRATTVSPNTWPEHLPEEARQYDEVNQALAYHALLSAIAEEPTVKGAYIWKWFTNVDTAEEGRIGFSPRNKAAAVIMDRFYSHPPAPQKKDTTP